MIDKSERSLEEKQEQSIKNFLRLYQSIVEQTGDDIESVIHCGLSATIKLMVAHSGAEITSEYLRALAIALEETEMEPKSDNVRH